MKLTPQDWMLGIVLMLICFLVRPQWMLDKRMAVRVA
jgi:hypothetical protein